MQVDGEVQFLPLCFGMTQAATTSIYFECANRVCSRVHRHPRGGMPTGSRAAGSDRNIEAKITISARSSWSRRVKSIRWWCPVTSRR